MSRTCAASKPASKKYGSELGAAHKKGVSATETLSHYRRFALILQSISACASPACGRRGGVERDPGLGGGRGGPAGSGARAEAGRDVSGGDAAGPARVRCRPPSGGVRYARRMAALCPRERAGWEALKHAAVCNGLEGL